MLFGWLSYPQGIQNASRLHPEGSTAEFPIMTHQVKRIAIIGAGSGGLAALKTFIHDIPKRDGERWEIDLFERRSNLGGIWSSRKSLTHHSSRLTNLFPTLYPGCGTMILLDIHISPKHRCTHNSRRTPLPRQVTTNLLISNIIHVVLTIVLVSSVTFPGFAFPPYTSLFPSYDRIQAYHHDFATHFNLHPHIHLNHSLESAYWVGNSSKGFWDLTISTDGPQEEVVPFNKSSSHNPRDGSRITKYFDHLVVANGHNHYPKIPSWATGDAAKEWLRNGNGRSIVHSIYFRGPEEYAGKVVLVVGAGASGRDIVTHSSGHAKKVGLVLIASIIRDR